MPQGVVSVSLVDGFGANSFRMIFRGWHDSSLADVSWKDVRSVAGAGLDIYTFCQSNLLGMFIVV